MIMADWVGKMMGIPKFFWTVFSNPETEGGGCIQTSASDAILLGMISAREDCVRSLRIKYPNVPRAVLLNRMVAYRVILQKIITVTFDLSPIFFVFDL